jgi:hypothetical protein
MLSTEAVTVDLIALRNWHFHCSLDPARTPEMRRWHRGQTTAINRRIPRTGPGSLNLVKVVLIEMLATQARKGLHVAVKSGSPFDWKKFCDAVTDALNQPGTR